MATQYKKEYPNLIIERLHMWANLNDVYFWQPLSCIYKDSKKSKKNE